MPWRRLTGLFLFMKKLFTFLILATLGWLAYGVGGYIPRTVLDGSNALVYTTNVSGIFTNTFGTNNVITATSNSTARAVQNTLLQRPLLVNSTTVGFFTSFKLTASGTAGPVYTLQKSYDGTNWESALTFSNAANGTTLVSGWTNLTLNQFGYVRVSEITNNSVRDITNLCVRWYSKENY